MLRIGKIVATHGINGAVILSHVVGGNKWLKKEHVLMLEMQRGSQIPYFMTAVKATNEEEYIVSLEDVVTVEAARKLIGKHVYVDEAILKSMAGKTPLLWIGFKIQDENLGDIGTIEDVMETGSQWLAKLTIDKKEVLLPLVEQTLMDIDLKAKTIYTNMPDGLLDVYLQK